MRALRPLLVVFALATSAVLAQEPYVIRPANGLPTVVQSGAAQFFINNDPAIANFGLGQTTPYVFTGTPSLGHNNLFIGLNAGDAVTDGVGNLGIGHSALGSLTTGINNTAIGWDSQFASVAGNNNTSLGEDACKSILTGGDGNTCLGYTAGYSTTTGDENLAIGPNALYFNLTGSHNVAVGHSSLMQSLSSDSTAVGHGALKNTTGTQNTAVGFAAGFTGTTQARNVMLGYAAGFYETGSDKLFIDDRVRADEADARAKALVYGVFDAAVANQRYAINAVAILAPIAFASLPAAPTNGMLIYCNDCTIANPCASGGTGALAKRLNGVWICN